ncbi:hypothetical protein KDA14_03455, partial [Candidatus Saccharibacteria bacterium]|nr:hypothetical protein [Candidatus Saccharibacteria bacterium]
MSASTGTSYDNTSREDIEMRALGGANARMSANNDSSLYTETEMLIDKQNSTSSDGRRPEATWQRWTWRSFILLLTLAGIALGVLLLIFGIMQNNRINELEDDVDHNSNVIEKLLEFDGSDPQGQGNELAQGDTLVTT